MDEMRMLGRNIQIDIAKQGISEEQLAESLGYTSREMKRIYEGKHMLLQNDIKAIAKALGEDVEDLMEKRGNEEYAAAFDCMGHFSSEENEDFILDLMDIYVEVKEKVLKL